MSLFGFAVGESLKAPLEAIKAKATIIMVVAAIAACVGAYSYHKIVVASLTSRLNLAEEYVEMLNKANVTLRGNVVTLKKSLDKQTAAVDAMVKAQKDADADAEAAITRAKQNAALWHKEYQKVLNAPRPPGDDCTAFKTKLDGYVTVRQQEETSERVNPSTLYTPTKYDSQPELAPEAK